MKTPYLCPGGGHTCGGRKYIKTSGIHFCNKNRSVRSFEIANIYINTFHNTSTVQIPKNHRIGNFFKVVQYSFLATIPNFFNWQLNSLSRLGWM